MYAKVIAQYSDDDGDTYTPGDELFITGKESSIYYPRPEHSLIKYGERIIHYAVAIPEGEGRYVLNRLTGDVHIERGPSMFLPDPRKEVVVRRILSETEAILLYPGNDEALLHNRMLRQSSQVNPNDVPMASMSLAEDIDNTYREAHLRSAMRGGSGGVAMASMPQGSSSLMKGMPIAASTNVSYAATASSAENAAQALVGGGVMQRKTTNTPPRTITLDTKYDGVVSVDVWTGYAVLLVRKNGDRRVVVGPKTVLLEYDERPMMLELSTGTPKTDARKLKTGFLRILNNSVSDVVSVETADSFAAQITLRYHLNFVGDNPEEWFNVENYVQFLAERTRSIIRRAAKEHTVQEIRDKAIDIVRTLILEAPVEGAGRPGRVFDENGMVIFDLDVETPVIQGDIDRLLRQTEQDTLRQIPALTHPRSRGGESPLREERDTVGETQNSPAGPKSQMGRRCMPAGQSPSGVIHKQLPNDLLAEEDNLCPGRPGAVDNIPIITASNATTRDDLPRPIMVLEQPPKEQRRKMTTNEHYASRNA